jgi:hypothetical protein
MSRMKTSLRTLLCLLILGLAPVSRGQTYSLVPLASFGPNGDGSIRPLDRPWVDSLNNQRGLACDPTTTNLVFVDTHSGSAGSAAVQGSIFIVEGTYGTNLLDESALPFTLNTNGINGGSYADAPAAVAADGVVYVANQVLVSSSAAVKIYRWDFPGTTVWTEH